MTFGLTSQNFVNIIGKGASWSNSDVRIQGHGRKEKLNQGRAADVQL